MEPYPIDIHSSAKDGLIELLDSNDIKYSKEADDFRFILEDGIHKWEAMCSCAQSAVLVYGFYPFAKAYSEETMMLLNRINGELISGSMLSSNERVIMRTSADCYDPYSACAAIARAIEYNAGAIVKYWQEIHHVGTGRMRSFV